MHIFQLAVSLHTLSFKALLLDISEHQSVKKNAEKTLEPEYNAISIQFRK